MKYYTPEKEELFIGYEVEIYGPPAELGIPRSWSKEIIQTGKHLDYIVDSASKGEARVQSLDKSDFKELGWKVISPEVFEKGSVTAFLGDILTIITAAPAREHTDTSGVATLYQGKCKSKNEFVKLTATLGI